MYKKIFYKILNFLGLVTCHYYNTQLEIQKKEFEKEKENELQELNEKTKRNYNNSMKYYMRLKKIVEYIDEQKANPAMKKHFENIKEIAEPKK